MSIGAVPPTGAGTPSTIPVPRTTSAAASFEHVLLEQLTTQLAATAAPGDDEGSAATSAYRDLLPRAMADGLAAAGGLGIAAAFSDPPPTGIPS